MITNQNFFNLIDLIKSIYVKPMLHLVKTICLSPLSGIAKISVFITYINTALKVLDNVVKPDRNKRNIDWKAKMDNSNITHLT